MLKKLFTRPQLPVLAGFILVVGLFAVVSISQQRQETRSRASGVCAQTGGDLEIDNCQLSGSVGGTLKGSNNTVSGSIGGYLIGDSNAIGVNVGKSIYGNSNTVGNNVNGCVIGNDNQVENNVVGTMTGTGNTARQVAGLGCPPNPLVTPTLEPTPTPIPTATPTPTPTPGTCADGIDNNQNELIDQGDPVCHTDGNQDNPNSYDPGRNEGPFTPTATPTIRPTITPTTVPPTVTPTAGPTITVPPGNTSIRLNLFLHGLGQGGDSANPNSGGNPNPLHPNRGVKVEVLNAQNQLILTKDGTINFGSSAGNFTGTVDLGGNVPAGVYIIKVKTEQFLRTLVPGIQNLTAGQANQLPATIMVNGDINNDNALNILDYNILMGCYSDLEPPVSCTAPNNILSDLDDDGDVNQFDYNLFLRELTNRAGQ